MEHWTDIESGHALLDFFEADRLGLPSFHDAEVLSLNLDRKGESRLVLDAWRMSDRVNDRGCFERTHRCIITFTLEGIDELSLEDFSAQNVIARLDLRREEGGYRIEMRPCFGLSGWLSAATIRVDFRPWGPDPEK